MNEYPNIQILFNGHFFHSYFFLHPFKWISNVIDKIIYYNLIRKFCQNFSFYEQNILFTLQQNFIKYISMLLWQMQNCLQFQFLWKVQKSDLCKNGVLPQFIIGTNYLKCKWADFSKLCKPILKFYRVWSYSRGDLYLYLSSLS